MQVSTSSWHYRLINFLDFDHPDNLCAYCWKTLFAIFFVGAMWPVAIAGGVFVVTMPFWHMFNPQFVVTVLAGLIATAEIIGLLILLYNLVKSRHEDEIYEGKRERPEPSLAFAWVKAQHDKVCPLIRFESE